MKKSFLFLLLGCSFLNAAIPIKNISEIAAGGYFILLLKQNKNVLALGDNTDGELGNGESGDDPVENPVTVLSPSKIGVLTNIKSIAGGRIHSLSLSNDGNVYSWGYNSDGELGNNTNNNSNFPVQVVGEGGSGFLTNIEAIAAGMWHSLALYDDGENIKVYGWGYNSYGELGDGTTNDSNIPVQVVGEGGSGFLTNIKSIAGGGWHSLSLNDDRNVYSWGSNIDGQLGNNTNNNSNFPVQVVGEGGSGFLTNIEAIAAGRWHSLALYDNGENIKVYSWGANASGQLGNGGNSNSSRPVQVVAAEGSDDDFLTNIEAIAGGFYHSLALDKNGNVYSWGANASGQLGNGGNSNSNVPILIESLNSIIAISANYNYSLALKNDGTVWFWGSLLNSSESMAIIESRVPIQLTEEMMQYIPKEFFSPKVFY